MKTASEIIKIETNSFDKGDLIEGIPLYFRMQKDIEKFYQSNINDIPSESEFNGSIRVLKEYLDIELESPQLQDLFNLHPKVRIAVASHGPTDTEVRSQLLNMITKTVLGCEYPTYSDHVDMDKFSDILKKYASLHSYKVVELSN